MSNFDTKKYCKIGVNTTKMLPFSRVYTPPQQKDTLSEPNLWNQPPPPAQEEIDRTEPMEPNLSPTPPRTNPRT